MKITKVVPWLVEAAGTRPCGGTRWRDLALMRGRRTKLSADWVVGHREGRLERYNMRPPEWLASLGFLSPRSLLPHGTCVSGSRGMPGTWRRGRHGSVRRGG